MPPIVKNKKKEVLLDNVIVLTTNSEEKSAKKLGWPTFTYLPHNINDFKNIVCIRWGNGYVEATIDNPIFSETDDFENVLNYYKSIENNVDKPNALQTLSKVVPTPRIFLKSVPPKTTVVYRPTAHAAGAGFALAKGGFEVKEGMYATEYIKTDKECRVFCCGSKTLTCSRKKTNKKESDICRSNWAYHLFRKTPPHLHKLVMKAKKALNLDLCGFDILIKGKKYYFLEGNAAVTLESKATAFYKKNLPILIKKKFPKLFKKK